MRRCKFDLKLPISGLNSDEYETIKLGDKYAKISDIDKQPDGIYEFVLLSKHKRHDFNMEIESMWTFNKAKRIFKLDKVILEIEAFDILSQPYAVPESHMNTLKKWFDEQNA